MVPVIESVSSSALATPASSLTSRGIDSAEDAPASRHSSSVSSQGRLAARDEHDVVALARSEQRGGPPDAAGRPGDQDDAGSCRHGFRTTLTQPSCFFWNISYAAGASSSGSRWVARDSTPSTSIVLLEHA